MSPDKFRAAITQAIPRTDWPIDPQDNFWRVFLNRLAAHQVTRIEAGEVIARMAEMDLFLEQIIGRFVETLAVVRADAVQARHAASAPAVTAADVESLRAACASCEECRGHGATIREFRSDDWPVGISLALWCGCGLGRHGYESEKARNAADGKRRSQPWLGHYEHLWDRTLPPHPTWPDGGGTLRYLDEIRMANGRTLRVEMVPRFPQPFPAEPDPAVGRTVLQELTRISLATQPVRRALKAPAPPQPHPAEPDRVPGPAY